MIDPRALALALGATFAATSAAEAGTSFNALGMNGASLNGVVLNGVSMNGVSFNGIALNGVSMNGTNLNGVALNGVVLNGLDRNAPPTALPARNATDGGDDAASIHRLGRSGLERGAPAD